MTIQPRKDPWYRLASGLYVPPLLNFSPGYPCGFNSDNCRASTCACGGPDSFEVTLSGIVNDICATPSWCTDLNDTYILAWDEDNLGSCWWTYSHGEGFGCDDSQILQLKIWPTVAGPPAEYTLLVVFGFSTAAWQKEFTQERLHCSKLNNESIPFLMDSWQCDASSSTCLVTAV